MENRETLHSIFDSFYQMKENTYFIQIKTNLNYLSLLYFCDGHRSISHTVFFVSYTHRCQVVKSLDVWAHMSKSYMSSKQPNCRNTLTAIPAVMTKFVLNVQMRRWQDLFLNFSKIGYFFQSIEGVFLKYLSLRFQD